MTEPDLDGKVLYITSRVSWSCVLPIDSKRVGASVVKKPSPRPPRDAPRAKLEMRSIAELAIHDSSDFAFPSALHNVGKLWETTAS